MRISDWSSDVCSSDLRTTRLDDRFEDRQDRLEVRQLLLVDQDIRILKLDRHLFRVGDEIRRQIAAIELHAFDDIKLRSEEHTSELQSLMRNSYAVFCLKKKNKKQQDEHTTTNISSYSR